jgi:fumarate reductase subunit D
VPEEHFTAVQSAKKIIKKNLLVFYIAVLTFWCSADAVDHMHNVGQLSQRWL